MGSRRHLPALALALLLAGTGPGAAGDYGLLSAARLGELNAVAEMLGRGISPNGYEGGYSPLMFAAGNGQVEMTRLLLARGAQTEHRDHNGDRALLWAAQRGHVDTVRLLLDAGSPPDAGRPVCHR